MGLGRNQTFETACIGTQFGRWTVIGDRFFETVSDGTRRSFLPCECECGTKADIRASNLIAGRTRSCPECVRQDSKINMYQEGSDVKRCSKCGQEKPVENFYRSRRKPGGYESSCKECNPMTVARREWSERYNRTYREQNYERAILNSARTRAKKLGVPFNLTLANIVVPDVCPVSTCSVILQVGDKTTRSQSPSLDRWVPALGYVQGNVWIICHTCNRKKDNMSGEQVLDFAQALNKAWKNHV